MNDLIRRGTVTSVNYIEGTVKIVQEDRDNAVSFDLPLLSFEYNPPAVGDMVVAVFLSNDSTQGFILGKPFNTNNPPKNGDKNIIRKDYDVDAFIEYDKRTKTLTIKAEHVVVKGLFTQEGDV
jgi:phage baseplate assembly protein gpV